MRRVALLGLVLAWGCGEEGGDTGVLKVRLLADLSGATASVGQAYHAGRVDRLRAINDGGGIRGLTIEYDEVDVGASVTAEFQEFLSFRASTEWTEISTIFGYGTHSTIGLLDRITLSEMLYITKSFAGPLAAPKARVETVTLEDNTTLDLNHPGAPYNFFVGTDYSTSIRGALDFVGSSGGGRIAFAHCTNDYACTSPLAAGKAYATGRLDVDEDITVEQAATQSEVDAIVQTYLDTHPVDWIWLGTTHDAAARIIRAAASYDVRFIANPWAFSEDLDAATSGDARGRVFGIVNATPYGAVVDSPAMLELVELHDRNHDPDEVANIHYVLGYATVVVWEIAIDRLRAAGDEVTTASIKDSLESLRGINTGGLLPPVSYSDADHRPSMSIDVYGIDLDGRLAYQTTTSLERRDDWLGY
jgi:branched-chain amino acid transport system substrate-binding protein